MGDIAKIMANKGEVDEAFKLHQEMIQVFDKLDNLDGKANALWSISKILLQKKDIQIAFEHLSESYQINLKPGRLNDISFVGLDLGQLLCQANQKDKGIKYWKGHRKALKNSGKKSLRYGLVN